MRSTVALCRGAVLGVALFSPLWLYAAGATLLHWPPDGTLHWFLEGVVLLGIGFAVLGSALGALSGTVLGFLSAFSPKRSGGLIAGLVAGGVFWYGLNQLLLVFNARPDPAYTYCLEFAVPVLAYGWLGASLYRRLPTR